MPSFATRQLIIAGLAANALRPSPGKFTAIPSFFGGWLAGDGPGLATSRSPESPPAG